MAKEPYIKPEVKSEILEADVLHQNWGSPAGGGGGGGCGGGGGGGDCGGGGLPCP
jgi:hypothetical protein